MSHDDDPDYRVLRRYLVQHDAPQFFHSALQRLIERAGMRGEIHLKKAVSFKGKPPLTPEFVEAYVEARKTQEEMAAIFGVKVRFLRDFMKEHRIRPSFAGIGRPKTDTRPIMELKSDPAFSVPVKVIRASYSAAMVQASL